MPRAKGSKNRRTLERETAKRVAAAHADLVKNAPPLDFSMPLDSLDVMEQAMRHFYFRTKIEERHGDGADLRRNNGPCQGLAGTKFKNSVTPAECRLWRAACSPAISKSRIDLRSISGGNQM